MRLPPQETERFYHIWFALLALHQYAVAPRPDLSRYPWRRNGLYRSGPQAARCPLG